MDEEYEEPEEQEGLRFILTPEQLEEVLQGGRLRIQEDSTVKIERRSSLTVLFRKYILGFRNRLTGKK